MDRSRARVVRSPRLAARRRADAAERRRRRRRAAIAAGVVVTLVAAGAALSRSRLFEIERIQVVGARTVSDDAVLEASGLRVGQNALAVDLDAVAARVRAALPAVASAAVERVGPLGIRISISERRAAVEVRSGGGRWWLDAAGSPVARPRKRGRVPVISLRRGRALGPETVAGVLTVWDALSRRTRARVQVFTPTRSRGLTFLLADTVVVFGAVERVPEKVRALRLVRARVRAEGRRLVRVDLRAPGHPAARIA